jgi:hypothetical protein
MNTPLTRVLSTPIVVLALSLAAIAQPVLSQEGPKLPGTLARVDDVTWGDIAITDQPAQRLITQPLTIEAVFGADAAPSAQMAEVVEAIPSASSLAPQPINPLDALKDPGATLNRFLKQAPPPPSPLDPLEFFKLPALDSGLTLNVAKF